MKEVILITHNKMHAIIIVPLLQAAAYCSQQQHNIALQITLEYIQVSERGQYGQRLSQRGHIG